VNISCYRLHHKKPSFTTGCRLQPRNTIEPKGKEDASTLDGNIARALTGRGKHPQARRTRVLEICDEQNRERASQLRPKERRGKKEENSETHPQSSPRPLVSYSTFSPRHSESQNRSQFHVEGKEKSSPSFQERPEHLLPFRWLKRLFIMAHLAERLTSSSTTSAGSPRPSTFPPTSFPAPAVLPLSPHHLQRSTSKSQTAPLPAS